MAKCVFCGRLIDRRSRSREHILPMWLLKATGDPHRKFKLWSDPYSGRDSIRPASTFTFPACLGCNQRYGAQLEGQARKIISSISEGRSITVANAYRLLDWLDKVRIGLWLGQKMLHDEGDFEPRFHIDTRLGRKDRIAVIAVDLADKRKQLSFGGTDNNVFRLSQAGFFLRINNIQIVNVSGDFLLSQEVGLPHSEESRLVSGRPGFLTSPLLMGDYKLSKDWSLFSRYGGTVIAQPVIDTRFSDPAYTTNIYCNSEVLRHAKDAFRANGIEQFKKIIPLQLVTNTLGDVQYHHKKYQRIRIENESPVSEGRLMVLLYQILLARILNRFPDQIVLSNGKAVDWIPGWLTKCVCAYQICVRLAALGIPFPHVDEIIGEIQRLDRILEQIDAHSHGTLVSEEAWISNDAWHA